MRLGSNPSLTASNEFIKNINQINELIQKTFLDRITKCTKMSKSTVMMGDSTIVKQDTFNPTLVIKYFKQVNASIPRWSIQEVTVSNNEDVRRIFTKSEVMIGNYILSLHMSIQFHVLLHYKPVQRVIDCQKELSKVVDLTKDREQQISDNSDKLVLDKLVKYSGGDKNLNHQELFEALYENDELREQIQKEIEKSLDIDTKELTDKKTSLFKELDSLLVETYQTVPILIDDTRLVTGEEGCLCMIDLEFIKNKNREGLFDPRKIPDSVQHTIIMHLDELALALREGNVPVATSEINSNK